MLLEKPESLIDAKRRLYCAYCRSARRANIMPTIDKTKDAPTGEALPDPTVYEWKKLIARYRS